VHGTMWEWVKDCFHDTYSGAPTDSSAWTVGGSGNYRVLRGGSWYFFPTYLRSAYRDGYSPDIRYNVVGFRLARSP
jgi:formylglycine-generating enzyme required for sulfatase activity